jgi:adenosylmethionine-8-amino-7-oxononanoate aminotransferase
MQQCLAKFADHPLVGEVRGSGLIGALELVANKETGEPFVGGAVGGYAQKMAQDNGLLIRTVAGSCLGFCPPLIITNQQIDEMIEKVAIALDATLDYCKAEKLLV